TANVERAFGGAESDALVTNTWDDEMTAICATSLGGAGNEDSTGGTGIAVDSDGNAYVSGDPRSSDFPTKNSLQAAKGGAAAGSDAFLTKINPDGSDLVYSTFIGGSGEDQALGLAVDSTGNAYVGGRTSSTSF